MKKTKKQFYILSSAFCLLAMCAGTNYSNAQPYQDLDGDGYGSNFSDPGGVSNNLDCDDNCAACYPGAPEILDGLDNDCNNLIDDGLMSVNVGADANELFGYAAGQDGSRTATVSNGYPPYSYMWTLSRALLCNYIISSGDELFYGGTCANNVCPGSGGLSVSPSCNGGTINFRLIDDANICLTVTDAQGSTASDCFTVFAQDARCFNGNSNNTKVKVCHSTGSSSNPWVQICISENALPAHLSHNAGDYVGNCGERKSDNPEAAYEFSINPNPSAGQFTIQYSSGVTSPVQITITDLVGKVVYNENISDFAGHLEKKMDLGSLNAGLYMVTVEDKSNKSISKIVIE